MSRTNPGLASKNSWRKNYRPDNCDTSCTGGMFPCHESSGPSSLEVEASGDAINVKDFTGKEEAGHDAALHRLEIHFTHVNASAGYEFFFERGFSFHGVDVIE